MLTRNRNTGHDFGGRSVGAGSLSIWTHNLKSFEFIPSYTSSVYSGMAARIGAGVEGWELFNHMAANNISLVAPGFPTVGVGGGWFANGGHGTLTSSFGLGADQVLSLNVVTADGRFLTADPTQNQDLFWALRGGGGSTFGVVTSVVMKAYPPLTTVIFDLSFSVNHFPPYPLPGQPPIDYPGGGPGAGTNNTLTDVETFWKGINLAYHYANNVLDAGGMVFSYIWPVASDRFYFTAAHRLVNVSSAEALALARPLYQQLNELGINVTLPANLVPTSYAGNGGRTGSTGSPKNTRYRSRLLPRSNWEDSELFAETFGEIRKAVEEGQYTFHGSAYSPTREVAGSPGADSAVNPAWRETVLHAMLMEIWPADLSAQEATEGDARVHAYIDGLKAVSPGAGSYMNEGDPTEKGWQQSFYGANYPRLLEIKKKVDPWGVFWAQTTVGSEGWKVATADGYPGSQNGRLCRA